MKRWFFCFFIFLTTIGTLEALPFGKKFPFNFTAKPLADIVNDFAAEKQINIMFPQGIAGDAFFKTNVTIQMREPLTLEQAWKQVQSLLELIGYTMAPDKDMFIIRKIDENIKREPIDIYINQSLNSLPDTEEVIKALFYLANINIKTSWENLNTILKDMLSVNANIQSDQKNNAILLTDKACNIKAVMKIILELDRGGLRDNIEVLPLYYTSAQIVDDLFNKQLLSSKQNQGGSTQEQISYFPKNTKVFGLERTNSLVIMGTAHAIDLVKNFILKYIDRPLESGKSILHIYDLQYLQAETFAPILQQIVSPAQSDQSSGKIAVGPKQYFRDVIVQPEITRKSDYITPSVIGGKAVEGSVQPEQAGTHVGGNRLIIAARRKDWLRIKSLIEKLDQPQVQVGLEVLVVDVTLLNDRSLGSQMRNKAGLNNSISNNVDWQSAQLSPPILKDGSPADALMANLLQIGAPFAAGQNLASSSAPGSLVLSLQDTGSSGVWSVWQLLNRYTNSVILAQPFIVTQNHKQASVSIETQRFLSGSADTSSVVIPVNKEFVTAALTVEMLPNINPQGTNINLQVVININEFIDSTAANRITRVVQTNANVGNGEVLALGGLTRLRENIAQTEVPLLGQIPIVGWLFKNVEKVKTKNNLVVLICPTIIKPRIIGGSDSFSERKLAFAKDDLDTHLAFENLRDPITRWFLKPEPCFSSSVIKNYTEQVTTQIEGSTTPTVPVSASDSKNKTGDSFSGTDLEQIERLKQLIKDEENPFTPPQASQALDSPL